MAKSTIRKTTTSKTSSSTTSSSSQPTGGMSTTTGKSVLVTPSGQIVGSAAPPTKTTTQKKSSGGGGGGGGSSSTQPVVQTVAQPTGGMSTTTGKSVLVTPQGQVVGSAGPISKPNTSSIQNSRSGSTIQSQVMSVAPQQKTSFKEDTKQNIVSLAKPAAYPSEYSGLSERRQGFEAAKSIFVGPFRAIGDVASVKGKKLVDKGGKISKATGYTVQAGGLLIPKSPLEVVGGAAAGYALVKSAPVVRTGASAVFGVLGTKEAIRKDSTPEQRIAGGIVAGLGATGAYAETAPYLKGFATKFSKGYKPVKDEIITVGKQQVTVKTIKNVDNDLDIRLIPEKIGKEKPADVKPGEGAVVRGGFGFTPKEQIKAFAGKELRLTTSQRGLSTKEGIIKSDPELSEYGFFFTPSDPVTGIPQTRVSRLGTQDFFKRPDRDSGVTFSSKQKQPQIFVTEPTEIVATGKTGTGGRARVSPKGSPELEVTSQSSLEITKSYGTTTIKGQKVDIYGAKLTKDSPTISKPKGKLKKGDIISSSKGSKRYVSPTSTLSGSLGVTRSTNIIINRSPPTKTKGIFETKRINPGGRIDPFGRRPGIPSKPTPTISTIPYKPQSYKLTPQSTPEYTDSFYRGPGPRIRLTPGSIGGGLPQFGMGSKSKSQIRKGVSGYTPSLTGSVRYNVLGETAGKGTIKLQAGLPSVRPVISTGRTLRARISKRRK